MEEWRKRSGGGVWVQGGGTSCEGEQTIGKAVQRGGRGAPNGATRGRSTGIKRGGTETIA